ncbi:MAG: hypothetical protein ABFS56_02915 [Pseudomonadota bacterium]
MTKLTVEQENFGVWLFEMDEALARFFKNLPDHLVAHLDFTPHSLDLLEDWILKKYSSVEKMLPSEEAVMVDGITRYIGETFRKTIAGTWEIRFDDPKYVYYGLPQLTGFSSPKIAPICPMRLVTTCVDRRKGHFLSAVLHNQIKRIPEFPNRALKTVSDNDMRGRMMALLNDEKIQPMLEKLIEKDELLMKTPLLCRIRAGSRQKDILSILALRFNLQPPICQRIEQHLTTITDDARLDRLLAAAVQSDSVTTFQKTLV